jgi:hypothetical protein
MPTHTNCDGVARRDFLRIGAISGLGLGAGLGLNGYLRMAQGGEVKKSTGAKAAIFVQLNGGPSHMDTFDMKPDAPDTHRGLFKEIKTNVPGVRVSEHLPKLAKCADKYAILRGVSHTLAAHGLGKEYLSTGNRPLPSLKFPVYGAIVSKEKGRDPELPSFVAVPNQANTTGYLGVEYGPLSTGSTPTKGTPVNVRGLSLSYGVTLEDIDRRQNMLKRFDTAFGDYDTKDKLLSGLSKFDQQAYAMMRSQKSRTAFDLSKESKPIADMFGDDSLSSSCMLAVRLVESGVRFVTVSFGGWDTHGDNFSKLKDKQLPALDAGLSGLFNALAEKGLLESTSIFVTGEFGRTPKINTKGGRDHYPRAMFCLLAGGGIKGGQVIGESDDKGTGPKEKGISPDDVAATFYQSLGIDHTREYKTPSGRPVMVVRHGNVIKQAFGG